MKRIPLRPSTVVPSRPARGKVLFMDKDGTIKSIDSTGAIEPFGEGDGGSGEPGPAGTITVGTVSTGAAGSSVIINNVGTPSAAILNITIPRGDAGADGADGIPVSRGDASVTSTSIANGVAWSGTISLGKTSIPNKITASAASWIRVYHNSSYLAADASRAQTTDATDEHGLVMEFILSASNLTWDISPQFTACNVDGSANFAISITNLSGSTQAITVTVNRLVIES